MENQKEFRQLRALMEMSALINSTLDSRRIRKRAIEAATRLVDKEKINIRILNPGTCMRYNTRLKVTNP